MNNKTSLFIVVFIMLVLISSSISPIFADYPDGFDNYSNGTVNPGEWKFNNGSLQPNNFNTNCLTGKVVQTPQYYSFPNVYELIRSSNCYTTSKVSATLSIEVNASSNAIAVVWKQAILSGSVPVANISTLYIRIFPYTSSSGPNLNSYDLKSLRSTYSNGTVSKTSVPGKTYWIEFVLISAPYSSTYNFNLALDNVFIHGANVILANSCASGNPCNFVMYDYATHQLFNISDYPSSYIQVNTTSGLTNTCTSLSSLESGSCSIINNIVIPEANLPLASSNLVTVWVGTSYYRTLIPPLSSSNYPMVMYLASPNNVVAYTLDIQDAQGVFTQPGTQFYISQGNINITSGYIGSGGVINVWLTPGIYLVTLYNPFLKETNTQPINIGQVAATATISINQLTNAINNTALSEPTYGLQWNSGVISLLWLYSDPTYSTSSLSLYVYIRNSTGTYTCSQNTLVLNCLNTISSGPTINLDSYITSGHTSTGSLSCSSNACNSTMTTSMYYQYIASNNLLTKQVFGPFALSGTQNILPGQYFCQVPPCNEQDFGSIPYIGSSIGGLDKILGNINLVTLGAMFFIFFEASAFGAAEAPIGFVVVSGTIAAFASFGFLPNPLGGTIWYSITFIAIIAFLYQRELRGAFP